MRIKGNSGAARREERNNALSLPNAVEELVKPIRHDEMYSKEVVDRLKPASREIALDVR